MALVRLERDGPIRGGGAHERTEKTKRVRKREKVLKGMFSVWNFGKKKGTRENTTSRSGTCFEKEKRKGKKKAIIAGDSVLKKMGTTNCRTGN